MTFDYVYYLWSTFIRAKPALALNVFFYASPFVPYLCVYYHIVHQQSWGPTGGV